ncbi:DUF1304 domain-containing protein [Haploplasma axanthum]|uniref:Predicted membrane protein n=1 Tax=Haploplasma axanthum TaxID=29552 RepID=A0A449BEQ4_HAPAX|nr:DUF1304 domain-containing protein [Haploplasma axanthum]VEU80790.1 Predicted membrane protein [Haploplasma axanthum]
MSIISIVFIMIVALEHFYILYLEMFAITSKAAKRSFGLSDEFLKNKKVKVMFANQGLYNGFLAVGLVLSAFLFPYDFRFISGIFFVSCVIVAAVFGALTSSKKILVVQGFPAILALIMLIIFK